MRTLICVLLLSGISVAPAGFAQSRSVADEVKIGVLVAQEFERDVILDQNPATLALINRVGQILIRNSDAPFPVTFRVIDSSDVNVFMLTGGFVYITAGLVAAAATEAELASTLAFGIARYSPKFERRPMLAVPTVPNTLLQSAPTPLPISVITGGVASASLGQQALILRQGVEKADRLALQYLYKAGYDATAYADFLQSVEARALPVKVELRTHPDLKDRIKKIQEWTRKDLPPRTDHAVTTAEFDRVRAEIAHRPQ